jgi:predicted Zn-dependent protease
LLFVICGCATVYNSATGKQEIQFIGTSEEVNIGIDIAKQIEKRFGVVKDPALAGRLDFVGQQLAAVSERRDLAYHFKIINDNSFNAFTILGGYVYVNKGLLDKVSSDSELASALGHEIGHVAARHPAKALEANLGYQILTGLIFSRGKNANFQRALDVSMSLIRNGYSRQDELLADSLGVKYMMAAGYSPQGFIVLLEKLRALEGAQPGSIGEFFSSHPPTSERIMAVKAEISWLNRDK